MDLLHAKRRSPKKYILETRKFVEIGWKMYNFTNKQKLFQR